MCVTSLIMLRGTYKKPADELLKKLVPAWIPHFIATLARKDDPEQTSSSEKIYILTILQLLYTDWTQQMVATLPKILPPVFQSIVNSAIFYQKYAVIEDLLDETSPKDED